MAIHQLDHVVVAALCRTSSFSHLAKNFISARSACAELGMHGAHTDPAPDGHCAVADSD